MNGYKELRLKIDDETHRRFKAKVLKNKYSMNGVIMDFIYRYANMEEDPVDMYKRLYLEAVKALDNVISKHKED